MKIVCSMNFYKILISLAVVSLHCLALDAQETQAEESSYQTFVRLNNNGMKGNDLYSALYSCYRDNMNIIEVSKPGMSQHTQARLTIVNIWPYLREAATHYDRQRARAKALQFAQAYVDIPISKDFVSEKLVKDDYYPTMVFYAASGTYNSGDYKKAIKYFHEYIATGKQDHRKNVMKYMAGAYLKTGDKLQAIKVLDEAVSEYPSDYEILNIAINLCLENRDMKSLQKYVSKAMILKPDDPALLDIQGKLYEDRGNYSDALGIYKRLFAQKPTSLDYAKHVALNNYNLGVLFSNKAAMESDKKIAAQYNRQAITYFDAAIPVLKNVLASDPTSMKFHQVMAVSYSMTGNEAGLASVNKKLAALGGDVVASGELPALMEYSDKKSMAKVQTPAVQKDVPLYSQYAKTFVEERIRQWQGKDPYETVKEYKVRVTERTRNAKIKELLAEAEGSYIGLYARDVDVSDFRLCTYDAEHEVFLAESELGDVLIPVPRANNEARIFESSWSGVRCMNPKYVIDNDKIVISALTFVTPMGQSYRFDGSGTLDYTETEVDMTFEDIDYKQYSSEDRYEGRKTVKKEKVTVGVSDVDKNIPVSRSVNDRTFAVIIVNENYDIVSQVPMALNDGKTFSAYCEKTLGLPKNNIRYYQNATYGMMVNAIHDIQNIASAYDGDIDILFYYAGHGIPNETTKDAFLLPVDSDGIHTETAYSLNKLYSDLGGMNARSVLVFLDACFSGANRDGSMLASARGVALKPKPMAPCGNMVVFSAASGEETAFPYEEKGHGMFTYFLLKKLQETKGNADLESISSYVIENVRRQSTVVNRKSQTPVVTPSQSMTADWKKLKLKP